MNSNSTRKRTRQIQPFQSLELDYRFLLVLFKTSYNQLLLPYIKTNQSVSWNLLGPYFQTEKFRNVKKWKRRRPWKPKGHGSFWGWRPSLSVFWKKIFLGYDLIEAVYQISSLYRIFFVRGSWTAQQIDTPTYIRENKRKHTPFASRGIWKVAAPHIRALGE